MLPLEEIEQLYYDEHPEGTFEQELSWYIYNGINFINKEYAILARTCDTTDSRTYEGELHEWGNRNHNAWFVAYAAGNLKKFGAAVRSLCHRYPYVVWARQTHGKYKIIKTEEFLRLIKIYGKIS